MNPYPNAGSSRWNSGAADDSDAADCQWLQGAHGESMRQVGAGLACCAILSLWWISWMLQSPSRADIWLPTIAWPN